MRCFFSSVVLVPWIVVLASFGYFFQESVAQEDDVVCPVELDTAVTCLLQEGISTTEFEACATCALATVTPGDDCSVQEQDVCEAVPRCCSCSEEVEDLLACNIRDVENSVCPDFSCENVVVMLEPTVSPSSTIAPTAPESSCPEETDTAVACALQEDFSAEGFEACLDCVLGEVATVLRIPCTDQENAVCQAVPTCCENRCTPELQTFFSCSIQNLGDTPTCPDFSCESVVLTTPTPSQSPVIAATPAPVTSAPTSLPQTGSSMTLAQCQPLDSPWMDCLNSNVSVNDSQECENCVRDSLPSTDSIVGCFSYGSNNQDLCGKFQVCKARCGVCVDQAHEWLSCQADTLAANVCNVDCLGSVVLNGDDGSGGTSTALVAGVGAGAAVLILGIFAFVWTKKSRSTTNNVRTTSTAKTKAQNVYEPEYDDDDDEDDDDDDSYHAPRRPKPAQHYQQRPSNQYNQSEFASGGSDGVMSHHDIVATPVAMPEAIAIVEEEANTEEVGNYQFKLQGDVDPSESTVNLPRGSSRGSGLSSSDNTPAPVPRSGARRLRPPSQRSTQRSQEHKTQDSDGDDYDV